MKLLHTSDWHLGHTLYGYDRSSEYRDFIRSLTRIVQQEQPDLMIVAGDIYHTNTPSNSVQQFFTESILRLSSACPPMEIVICAGNHDSGSRLEIDRELWKSHKVHILGNIQRQQKIQENGNPVYEYHTDRHLLEIADQSTGKPLAYVVALPFISPFNVPDLDGNTPKDKRMSALCQFLLDKVAERNRDEVPVVMTAHLALLGSNFSCHQETGLQIGGEDCMEADVMGKGYDYLALGHIHKAQTLPGCEKRIRYSGSPLPISFDETQEHTVSMVEIQAHGDRPLIREIPIPLSRRLLTIPEEPVELEKAMEALDNMDRSVPAYIRLNVLSSGFLPSNASSRVVEKLEGSQALYCYIRLSRPESVRQGDNPLTVMDVNEFQKLTPMEVANRYHQQRFGCEMDKDLLLLLEETVKEIGLPNPESHEI